MTINGQNIISYAILMISSLAKTNRGEREAQKVAKNKTIIMSLITIDQLTQNEFSHSGWLLSFIDAIMYLNVAWIIICAVYA